MNETNKQKPAHNCATEVARQLYSIHSCTLSHAPKETGWDDEPASIRQAWQHVAEQAPRIIIKHAGDDVREWLARQSATSSGWRKWLFGIACASVGAAVLYFFPSCTPMTPEQVQQLDTAHAIMHRVTGTDCTLCSPIVTPAK